MNLFPWRTEDKPSRLASVPYSQLSHEMVKEIPELRIPFEHLRSAYLRSVGEEPGQHNVFAELLTPFVHEQLREPQNRELLRRIFGFVEEAAKHPNILVREVVAQSLCEELCGRDQPWSRTLARFMGPATAKLLAETCDAYHRAH